MPWVVRFEEAFEQEFHALPLAVREAMMAMTRMLQDYGPLLGRPHVDTLKGSTFANMKELRFLSADGVWRVAFAFDPTRQAILLVAGNKAGLAQARFYRSLISRADSRYATHLARSVGRIRH